MFHLVRSKIRLYTVNQHPGLAGVIPLISLSLPTQVVVELGCDILLSRVGIQTNSFNLNNPHTFSNLLIE